MANVIDTVAAALSAAGYRTGAASPGGWMPEIQSPVAAVSLDGVDAQTDSLTVRATVVSPVANGAREAENQALQVCRVLRGIGGECQLEPCEWDEKTELFSVGVRAKFYGNVLGGTWSNAKACAVTMGGIPVSRPVSFSAWRNRGELMDIAEASWQFQLEEILTDTATEVVPVEPFSVVVGAGGRTETYTDCYITQQRRILEQGRLVQIREGTAKTKL